MSTEDPRADIHAQQATPRYSISAKKASIALRQSRKSIGGSMARAYKLTQYYKIFPCQNSEQVFCFAACLLKWFRLEGLRLEALAAAAPKAHHGDRNTMTPTQNASTIEAENTAPTKSENEDEEDEEQHQLQTDRTTPPVKKSVTNESTSQINLTELPTENASEAVAGPPEEQEAAETGVSDHDENGPDDQAPQEEKAVYGLINKAPIAKIQYVNSQEKRNSYRLAFSTMKYINVLEKLLDEISFYNEYTELKDEQALVLAVCYDYTMRNYQRRTLTSTERQIPMPEKPQEYLSNGRLVIYPPGFETFKAVEEAIQKECVHLAAAVARIRVRNQVGSLKLLLPEEWRKAEQYAENMPAYGWYNQLLGKQDIVTGWLKDHGFRRVMAGRMPQSFEYSSDKHCADVFIFNKADLATLLDSDIVIQKNLVLQDRSTCLGVHCCLANVGGGEEVLFVNCVNVYTAVHMEGLIGNKFPLIQPVPQIRCIRPTREDEDIRLPLKMGSKTIKATSEEFLSLEPHSDKNKSIRHIFIEASDTRSAVVNPIWFLEVEADESHVIYLLDPNILRDMWLPPGTPSKEARKTDMINRTTSLLKHALRFSGVRTVTLLTHSEDPQETDALVTKVLELANKLLLKEAEAMAQSNKGMSTATVFNLQIPIFPGFQEEREAFDSGKPTIIMKNNSIRVPASGETNGFCIYIMNKESILLKSNEEGKQDDDQTKESRPRGRGKKH